MEEKKESAAMAAEVLGSIKKGEMTTNQARAKFGLEPIGEPAADAFIKRE
ncbi:hypothetical protein [Paenibacillus sp. HJGM_3]